MITNLKNTTCLQILKRNYIGYLGYIYNNLPFVVPITYHFDKENIIVIGYTGEGHKTKALRLNNAVSLEIAEVQSINNWRSILVQGTLEELKGTDAKYYLHLFSNGVKALISKKEKKELDFIPQFSGKTHSEATPIVYQLNIQEITGKQRKCKTSGQYASIKRIKKIKDILRIKTA